MNPSQGLTIRIADVSIAVKVDGRLPEWQIAPAYRPFATGDKGEKADIILGLHSGLPDLPAGKKVFDSSPIWTLYRRDDTSIIKIFDTYHGLKRVLVLPPDLERADLYLDANGHDFTDPFVGPTLELLMINYLARISGVILHACSIEHRGKGYLFAGESGAGKSTLANLWDQAKGAEVLSDDRTIVRRQAKEYRVYGTPWHGDAPFGLPRGANLEGIFFIEHGPQNTVRNLNGVDAMLQFLKCSFPPYWDATGMESAMETFEKLAGRIPCCELSFKPDSSAIEFVNSIK